MAIYEHGALAPLADIINQIEPENQEWGFVTIKRHYMHVMTNEAFLQAIRPVFNGILEAHIAYHSNHNVYIAWHGKQKVVYKLLRNLASTSLILPNLMVDASVLVSYLDPAQRADEIRDLLASDSPAEQGERGLDAFDDDTEEEVAQGPAALRVSPEQISLYNESSFQKPYRRHLHILVVEDELFSQKLLLEILRSVRVRNNNESPVIDTVQSIRDAWKLFLKKAPDIIFIDLNLTDGSGHTLARAVKELDPRSHVIILTSNSFEEELNVARQNNVDGFITKPYNKKQILDGINRYVDATKPAKGSRRGSFG